MKKQKVFIPNLTCASCVLEVEQVMRQQDGVVWAIVNFAAGEATILYDPGAFSITRLVQAVGRLGFQVQLSEEITRRTRSETVRLKPLARMQQWVRALGSALFL